MPPLLAVVARSGTGKTTLLERLLPLLQDAGLRCAVIKHSHHDFEIDVPGKDSHRLRRAGARQVLLASPYRTFWVREGDGASEPGLESLVARLDAADLDLVLLEGYRHARVAKLEVFRADRGEPPLYPEDRDVVAVAADAPAPAAAAVPWLPLNEPAVVADFVVAWYGDRR